MKILILANNGVGLYQFRKELIEELLKENIVTIALPYGKLVDELKDLGCFFIDTPLERRGLNPIKDIKLLRQYIQIIKNIKPDLVITYTIKPNIYGGIASRYRKVRYVSNITGLGSAFEGDGCLKKIVTLLYKFSLKKAKVVFFENEENEKLFINNGITRKEQTHRLNGAGVNLNKYSVVDYPKNNTVKFLFMGRIMKEKGIDELLDAIKRLKNEGVQCKLDILGTFEDDYKDIVDKYVNDGIINYYGYQKDVRPYIEKCHCFVLPSWHEGMANTNLECAASGRPLITSNISGCKEAVIDGVSGYLCNTKDAEDLYQKMKKFINLSYEAKKSMGLAGRKHMEEVFDKRLVVKETISIIVQRGTNAIF